MELLQTILRANGWFFTITFLSLSFATVTLIILRIVQNFLRGPGDVDEFFGDLEDSIQGADIGGFIQSCQQQTRSNAIDRLFLAGYPHRNGRREMQKAMHGMLQERLLPELQSAIAWLRQIALVSPMLGLLGTVAGMISAFRKIAGTQNVNTQQLADSIGMALYTTFEGLTLGIIAIMAFFVFSRIYKKNEQKLHRSAQRLLDLRPQL